MPARRAPIASPPNALRVWCDRTSIYAEIPAGSNGISHTISLPRSGLGLGKLLETLYGKAEFVGTYTPSTKSQLVGTKTQHAMAEAALRRAGAIK
jgi:hypothetical protein